MQLFIQILISDNLHPTEIFSIFDLLSMGAHRIYYLNFFKICLSKVWVSGLAN